MIPFQEIIDMVYTMYLIIQLLQLIVLAVPFVFFCMYIYHIYIYHYPSYSPPPNNKYTMTEENDIKFTKLSKKNIVVSFQTGGKIYNLFEIRRDRIDSMADVKRLTALLQQCKELFMRGNFVCGTLCDFYESLSYIIFNDLVIYDISDPLYEDNINKDRVFCVDGLKFNRDSEKTDMEGTLSVYFVS